MHLGKHTHAHAHTHEHKHTQEESEIPIIPGFGMEFLGSAHTSLLFHAPFLIASQEVHFLLLHLRSVCF